MNKISDAREWCIDNIGEIGFDWTYYAYQPLFTSYKHKCKIHLYSNVLDEEYWYVFCFNDIGAYFATI